MKQVQCLFILLIFAFSGCALPPTAQPNPSDLPDSELFNDKLCVVGCWQGMKPGETTNSEFEVFFNNLPFPIIHTGHENNTDWYSRGSSGRKDEYALEAYVTDGYLKKIRIVGPFNLTLEKVVDKLGVPENIRFTNESCGDMVCPDNFAVSFIYPTKGYVFETLSQTGKCIMKDTVIYSVIILQSGRLDDLINDWVFPFTKAKDNIDISSFKQWQGFGCNYS